MDSFNLNNFFNNDFSNLSHFTNSLKESLEKISINILKNEKDNEQYYTVDKVVDNFAVCENSNSDDILNIPLDNINGNIKEGDCLVIKDGQYEISKELTNTRKELINEKMNNLYK